MSDSNPLVNRFPWTGTVKVSGSTGGGATGIAAITGGFIDNTVITNGSLSDADVMDCTITGGSIDGATIGAVNPAPGVFTTLAVRLTSTFGNSFANYSTIVGANSLGYPTWTAIGSDTNIDLAVIPKGSGFFNARKLYVGSAGARPSVNANTVASLRVTTVYSGAMWQAMRIAGGFSGSVSADGGNGIVQFSADADSIAAGTGGDGGIAFVQVTDTMTTGATGGRTAHVARLVIDNDIVANPIQFQVGGAWTARAFNSIGGTTGAPSGNLFGGNVIVGLHDNTGRPVVTDGAGGDVNSLVGIEIDTYASAGTVAQWHYGLEITNHQQNGVFHENRGTIADAGIVLVDAVGTTAPLRHGIALGGPNGQWPLGADSQFITSLRTGLSSPTYEMSDFLDFSRVQINRSLYTMIGASLDLNGNSGAQVAGGVTSQVRDGVYAKTAVVATITPIDGGMYLASGVPSLAVTAPPTSGTTATATIATHTAVAAYTIGSGAGGSGYVVGDILTQTTGTFVTAATIEVLKVDGTGKVRSFKVLTGGNYSVLPVGTVPFSGGTFGSSGFQGSLYYAARTVTVSGAGTNYPQYPAPIVSFSGGTVFRDPVFLVTMTATQVPLPLNTGSSIQPDSITLTASGPTIRTGTGAASGTQPRGSIWLRSDGGVGTTVYVSQGGGTWNPILGV